MFSFDDDIYQLTESKISGQHRCMNGQYVDLYTTECRDDIIARIEDAMHSRDGAGSRTDERIHYNGLLSVLRRKLRDIDRELAMLQAKLQHDNVLESLKKYDPKKNKEEKSSNGQRILKLAGLF